MMILNPMMWKTYHNIRRHLLEFAIAWLLFIGIVLMYNYIRQQERENAPATDYLEVKQVAVPDFAHGDNPVMIFDRIIKRAFHGVYTVEVQEVGTLIALEECTESFPVNYAPDKKLPKGGPTLFWFIGKKCEIPIGQYRLYTCWDIERERASTKHYCVTSPIFTVFDPSIIPERAIEPKQGGNQ